MRYETTPVRYLLPRMPSIPNENRVKAETVSVARPARLSVFPANYMRLGGKPH